METDSELELIDSAPAKAGQGESSGSVNPRFGSAIRDLNFLIVGSLLRLAFPVDNRPFIWTTYPHSVRTYEKPNMARGRDPS